MAHVRDESDIGLAGAGEVEECESGPILQQREELLESIAGAVDTFPGINPTGGIVAGGRRNGAPEHRLQAIFEQRIPFA
jgi:hypothetical protein